MNLLSSCHLVILSSPRAASAAAGSFHPALRQRRGRQLPRAAHLTAGGGPALVASPAAAAGGGVRQPFPHRLQDQSDGHAALVNERDHDREFAVLACKPA